MAQARDSISCNVRQRGRQPATVYLLRPYGCRCGVYCQRAIRRSRVPALGFLRSNAKRPLIILRRVLKVVIEAATGPTRRPFLCPHCHAPMTVVGMTQTFSCRHATALDGQSRAAIPNSCSQPQAEELFLSREPSTSFGLVQLEMKSRLRETYPNLSAFWI